MSTNQSCLVKEKEWKGIKLTPITEEEDGTNNFHGANENEHGSACMSVTLMPV